MLTSLISAFLPLGRASASRHSLSKNSFLVYSLCFSNLFSSVSFYYLVPNPVSSDFVLQLSQPDLFTLLRSRSYHFAFSPVVISSFSRQPWGALLSLGTPHAA